MASEGHSGSRRRGHREWNVMGGRLRELASSVRNLPTGGVLAVISGFVLHLSLGGGYAFGNLTTYMTSYLHVTVGQDVGYAESAWVGTLLPFISGLAYLPGSVLYRRVGRRATILAAGVLISGSIALTSLTVRQSMLWVTVTYGVLQGAGVGLLFMVPLLVSHRWFPHHAGLVSGVVTGGYCLGGVLFTTLQTGYLNPDNVSPHEEDGFFHDRALLQHVPEMFMVEAAVTIGLQVFGILAMRDPPVRTAPQPSTLMETSQHLQPTEVQRADSRSLPPVSDAPQTAIQRKHDGLDEEDEDEEDNRSHSLCESFGKREMYALLIGYGTLKMAGTIINPLWKAFGQTFIQDDYFLSMVGSGCSVFSMLGQLTWGCLCDRLGFKMVMSCLSALLSVLFFSLPATPVGGRVMLMIWVWSLYFTYAGVFPAIVAGTVQVFGPMSSGLIFSTISISSSAPFPLALLLYSFLQSQYGYLATFLLAGAFAAVGLGATLTLGGRLRPQKHLQHSKTSADPPSSCRHHI